MTTSLRRLYAILLAHRVNKAFRTRPAHTLNVHSLGLFRDARKGYVRADDRLLKLQSRINRRLDPAQARVAVTRQGNRLNVYATINQNTAERCGTHGSGT